MPAFTRSLDKTSLHTQMLSVRATSMLNSNYLFTPHGLPQLQRSRASRNTFTCSEFRRLKTYAITTENGTRTPQSHVRPRIGSRTSTAFTAALKADELCEKHFILLYWCIYTVVHTQTDFRGHNRSCCLFSQCDNFHAKSLLILFSIKLPPYSGNR